MFIILVKTQFEYFESKNLYNLCSYGYNGDIGDKMKIDINDYNHKH
jgi:hypothetical protein